MPLALASSLSASDDGGRVLVSDNGGMNFSEVYRNDIQPRWILGNLPIFNNKVPIVFLGALVVYQANFQEAKSVFQRFGKRDGYFGVLAAGREAEKIPSTANACVLPDGCPEPSAMVREVGFDIGLSQGPGGCASLVKAILSGIDRVGVKPACSTVVTPLLRGVGRHPMLASAEGSPMPNQNIGVDTPTLAVQAIGLFLGNTAWKYVGSDQRLLFSMYIL